MLKHSCQHCKPSLKSFLSLPPHRTAPPSTARQHGWHKHRAAKTPPRIHAAPLCNAYAKAPQGSETAPPRANTPAALGNGGASAGLMPTRTEWMSSATQKPQQSQHRRTAFERQRKGQSRVEAVQGPPHAQPRLHSAALRCHRSCAPEVALGNQPNGEARPCHMDRSTVKCMMDVSQAW